MQNRCKSTMLATELRLFGIRPLKYGTIACVMPASHYPNENTCSNTSLNILCVQRCVKGIKVIKMLSHFVYNSRNSHKYN